MSYNFISVIIGNMVTIACFTAITIHFNNPWLVLIALLFFQSYTEQEPHEKTDI